MLVEICTKAGLPKGVLNIVHGLGTTAGQAIVEHPNIKAISFTGGTKTGAHIAKTAHRNGTTLKHEVIKAGLIKEKEYDKIMSPLNMTKPK